MNDLATILLTLGAALFAFAGALYLFARAAIAVSDWASRQAGTADSTGSVDRSRAETTESAVWPLGRPDTGTAVRLNRHDAYLAERLAAPAGTVGTVVAWSALSTDDEGVLVDWGNGQEVRCNLDELDPVDTPPARCLSVDSTDPWKCILPAGHESLHRGAHPRVKWATADEAADL